MSSPANPDDKENPTLAPQSPDDFDEQVAQLPRKESASAHVCQCRPRTPTYDEKDDPALALRSSPLPSDDFDEQIAQFHRTGPGPISEEAPSENADNYRELALNLSQLPAGTGEPVSEPNQRTEPHITTQDAPVILLWEKVRITLRLHLGNH